MRKALAVFVLASVVASIGCNIVQATEGDRELADQNQKAAALIQKKTADLSITVPAMDIELNSKQQLENWGPPKEPKPYDPATSKAAREKAKEEHKDSIFWPVVGGIASAALSWFLKSTGFGGIPFIGQAIAALSPKLANGAAKNEGVAIGLQVAIDESRDELDKAAALLRAKLADKLTPEIADLIPDGGQLVDAVRRVLGDRGLLNANTALYAKNNTGIV